MLETEVLGAKDGRSLIYVRIGGSQQKCQAPCSAFGLCKHTSVNKEHILKSNFVHEKGLFNISLSGPQCIIRMSSPNDNPGPTDELPNLELLAEATQRALEVLKPWKTGDKSRPDALIHVTNQVVLCKDALTNSIVVAQQGYTLADEAIGFATFIDADGISEEDRRNYLVRMLEISSTASENVQQAQVRFRNGRVELIQVIKEAQGELSRVPDTTDDSERKFLKRLEEDTSVLENIEHALSSVIAWWTGIGMTHKTQEATARTNLESFNKIRQKATVKRWEELKQNQMIAQIQKIEDNNPDLASDLCRLGKDTGRSINHRTSLPKDGGTQSTSPSPITERNAQQPENRPSQTSYSPSPISHNTSSSTIPTVTPTRNEAGDRSSPSSPLRHRSLIASNSRPSSPVLQLSTSSSSPPSPAQSQHVHSPASIRSARTPPSLSPKSESSGQSGRNFITNLDAFHTIDVNQIPSPTTTIEQTNPPEETQKEIDPAPLEPSTSERKSGMTPRTSTPESIPLMTSGNGVVGSSVSPPQQNTVATTNGKTREERLAILAPSAKAEKEGKQPEAGCCSGCIMS